MDIEPINDRIAEVYGEGKWIIAADVAVIAGEIIDKLKGSGADSAMIVAPIEGVGIVPQVDRIHYTRTRGNTIMQGVRAFVRSIEDPSADLMAAVDEFDPGHSARVINLSFSRHNTLFDRSVYGGMPTEWRALEDKMVVDELWDAAGINRAPSEIVEPLRAPDAANRLAGDHGTVWVGDNKEGWHGGGEYVRWVREPDDAQPNVEWFTDHTDRVRVMPFLDGLPCSIHGFVTHNGVAVFNPVEMIVYRYADKPAFYYASGANFWNPPGAVRDEMRSAARSVGHLLHDRHGYLGGFGIDGICTADGFRPTELNPRISRGHHVHTDATDFPLRDVERLVIAGDLTIDASDFESMILDGTIDKRRGGPMFELESSHEPAKTGFVVENGAALAVDADGPNDGVMELGTAAFGSAIFARFDPDRTPIGPSVAPRALAILDLARELWGVDAPMLEAAPDLCS